MKTLNIYLGRTANVAVTVVGGLAATLTQCVVIQMDQGTVWVLDVHGWRPVVRVSKRSAEQVATVYHRNGIQCDIRQS